MDFEEVIEKRRLVVSYWLSIYFVVPTLFGFGLAFVLLQVTIIMTSQHYLPEKRGTVMSLVSFNMFIGARLGSLSTERSKLISVISVF